MKKTKRFAFLLSIVLIIGMMGYGGCGSGGGGGDGGTPVERVIDVDSWPELPEPTTPYQYKMKSETITYIAPFKADLTPTIIAAKGEWYVWWIHCGIFECELWGNNGSNTPDGWNDESPITFCDTFLEPWSGITLMREGVILDPPEPDLYLSGDIGPICV
jgi:hypothetical protein